MKLVDRSMKMFEYSKILYEELNKYNIFYIVENNDDTIEIWFDKEANFGCIIDCLSLHVTHLDGSVLFNLDEGWETDIAIIPYVMKHILRIMSYDLYQIETYRFKKRCSVTQYLLVDNERIPCSSFTIMHILFFIPLLKKQRIEKHYRYNKSLKKLRFINE